MSDRMDENSIGAPEVITPSKVFTHDDFRQRAWVDHRFFCKELFPMAFWMDFAQVHVDIMSLLFDPAPNILVIAPRKIGKTPLMCFSYPIKNILYHTEPYQLIVSETMDESKRHVQKIVMALETTEKVQHYYGNLVDRNREVQKESVQFTNGDWLRCGSFLKQIRGTGGDWTPPSVIIADDLQSNKMVKTPSALTDAINWFEDEIMYSKAQRWKHAEWDMTGKGKVRALGTSLHPFCIVEQLFKDSRFKSKRYGILMNADGEPDIVNGVSIWEDNFPTAELYAEMRDAEKNGRLGNWLQERMNMPYKYGSRTFNVDDLRYWNVGANRFDIFMGQPVIVLEEDIGLAVQCANSHRIGQK